MADILSIFKRDDFPRLAWFQKLSQLWLMTIKYQSPLRMFFRQVKGRKRKPLRRK